MFHQEDAGLNVEMAKLAFAKGIWSYVCKMNNALRNYSLVSHPQTNPAVSAVTLIQKVRIYKYHLWYVCDSNSNAIRFMANFLINLLYCSKFVEV